MQFYLKPLRFSFIALEPLHFPAGKSANILRGAFGLIFRRLACTAGCRGAKGCELPGKCAYGRFFEPAAGAPGPSGLADWPRPFVFRAMHLDGRTFMPGQSFHFDMHVFDTQPITVSYLVLSFTELAREGLGPRRGKAELTAVCQIDEFGLAGDAAVSPPLALELDPATERVSHLLVRFVTPTELKSSGQPVPRPDFGILAARARDRISTLRELYGEGSLTIGFREFGERASLVKMTRCELSDVAMQRRSSRTGQTHSLGGFIGLAEYEGDLGEFLPYLKAATWTGVGRQTVWGKGKIETEREAN